MPPPDLVLTVPCYNEAARLSEPAFLEFVESHPGVAVVFVDDGSSDATRAVLERMCRSAPHSIAVLELGSHKGKGEAVRAGMLAGIDRGARLVGFWDADLSTPLALVDDFLALFAARPDIDIVLGSRVMMMGRDIRRQAWRHYLGRVFATGASLALKLPLYDTQCGAKLFRANDALASILSAPFRSRWIFDVELLARYAALPAPAGGPPRRSSIYELPLASWHHRTGSKLRPSHAARAIVDLARIWRERRRRVP